MRRLWFLLVIAALLAVPLSALAQGDDQEWEEYTSDDERITLQYPAEWYVESAYAAFPTPIVIIANSEDAVYREEFQSGDIALILTFVPLDTLDEMDIELPDDYELLDVINAVLSQSEDSSGTAVYGEAEAVELDINEDETIEAARAAFTSDIYDGAMYVTVQDEILIMALMAAYPDQFTDDIETLELGILTSLEYDRYAAFEAEPTEEPAE
jgi:hypothetical protein